jgi:uncharacterized protein YdeI (YjbR/CyaY-like superfamily)
MEPIYFSSQAALRAWFEQNHTTETELIVGYHKKATGRESITWSQSVDEALCFGWIDGIRRSVDNDRYCIRFTPRKTDSNWSTVNIQKVEELTKSGKMRPAGLDVYSKRKESRSGIYTYETLKVSLLPENMESRFRLNEAAWDYFQSQAPSYRKVTIRWIVSARQEDTRIKRLDELISSCEAGEWIRAMRWGKKS